MRLYARVFREELPSLTPEEARAKQLKLAAQGLLMALREARNATHIQHRKYWLMKAKKFKAYMERLGKNNV